MTEPPPRPEVVQAIYDALMSMDPAKLETLERSGTPITPTERRRAEELFAAAILAGQDHQERRVEVWHVLIGRQWESPPTWEQLFDDLRPDRAARLAELYDALPDRARAEYDSRHGPPVRAADDWHDEEGLPAVPRGEAALWRTARTLADIGELTAQWLEGRLTPTPSHLGPPDSEIADLISVLAAANRAGFVTHQSQLSEPLDEGGWEQRASVSGFAGDEAFIRLMTAAADADLIITAARAGEDNWGPVLAITREDGEEHTWDGGGESRSILQSGYGHACHPQAVDALGSAWQITLIDPPGGDETMCSGQSWSISHVPEPRRHTTPQAQRPGRAALIPATMRG